MIIRTICILIGILLIIDDFKNGENAIFGNNLGCFIGGFLIAYNI
jgi:hypothetical protein